MWSRHLVVLALFALACSGNDTDTSSDPDTDVDTSADTDADSDTDTEVPVAPVLQSSDPEDGATDVPVDVVVELSFNTAMTGGDDSISVTADGETILGEVFFVPDEPRIEFTPDFDLAYGTQYELIGDATIGSVSGLALGGLSLSFTTEAAPILCGNDTLDDGEFCDDGNQVDGDGCSADCSTGMTDWGAFPEASFVIGQFDFSSVEANHGEATVVPDGLSTPIGAPVVVDDVMYVLDAGQQRILIYDPVPNEFGAVPTDVIGRVDLHDGPTQGVFGGRVLAFSRNLCTDGQGIAVADPNAQRVRLWPEAPLTDRSASYSLATAPPGSALDATSAATVWGCALGGGRIAVVDRGGHRVLLFNEFPTESSAAADVVLGQTSFGEQLANDEGSPTASSLRNPGSAWTDGERLVVTDSGNHRLLIWNSWPTTNGQPADVILGQPNATTAARGAGTMGLNGPSGVWSNGEMLVVADTNNNRVVAHHGWPETTGEDWDAVVGQADFDAVTAYDDNQDGTGEAAPTARTLKGPGGVFVHDGALFVTETASHRVVVFGTVQSTPLENQFTNADFEAFGDGGNPPFEPPDDWLSFGYNFHDDTPFAYVSFATLGHNGVLFNPVDPDDASNRLPGWEASRALKSWGPFLSDGEGEFLDGQGFLYQQFDASDIPAGSMLRLSGRAYVSGIDAMDEDASAYLVIKCFSADFSVEYCGGGPGLQSYPIDRTWPLDEWRLFTIGQSNLPRQTQIIQAGVEFRQCSRGTCGTVGGSVYWDDLTLTWKPPQP